MLDNLHKNKIGKFLVSKFDLLDEDHKATEVNDPLFLPFYYYLNEIIKPKNMMEIGLGMGLCSGSFLLGNKSVDNFLGVQESKTYYNKNIAIRNVKKYYKKKFKFSSTIVDFKSDFIILREKNKEKMSEYLSSVFEFLEYDGMLCCDYAFDNKSVLDIFCRTRNLNYKFYNTRYGVGIITK